MHILFVDDTSDTRDIFRLAFEMAGHTARLVSNGADAVQAVREELFDVIVLDVEMPRMNGWDAAHEIRALENGATVPIVMFTAHHGADEKRKAKRSGANFVLHKPVLPQEMLFALERVKTLI